MPTNVSLLLSIAISFYVTGFYAQNRQLEQSFFFDHDSYELTSTHKHQIDSLNTVFIKDSIKIDIKAYTNNFGTKTYNLKLSHRRANSIKTAFENFNTITATGYGELDNSLSESRRVDVFISVFDRKPEYGNSGILNNNLDVKIGDTFRLDGILFKGGMDVFLNESYSELKKLLDFMKSNTYHIKLLGHICCTTDGSEGLNNRTKTFTLSLDRAKAVFDYLTDNGIDKNRMGYVGLAGSFPTGKAVKYDRRVEIEIVSFD
ncbi:OmpA family protein [Psychroserpens mesophilus]|uniref:OmpA family protein n=1 Tax=Psychroserpens mesophilus TaxID=325473 RepID=UPI003D655A4B